MDLGFAVTAEADNEWGEEVEEAKAVPTEVVEEKSVATVPVSIPLAPSATPAAPSHGTATSSGAGLPKNRVANKMHQNPRTRYFIIKCNNHTNLVNSIKNNVWATQRHNETKLNEALRISPYVILLFSVNMTGGFQGYARMMGRCGESSRPDPFNGFGKLFDIKWLKLHDLDFNEINHIRNPWNEYQNIKISRDGQELPNKVGAEICDLIDAGVYAADPDETAPDEEVPNQVPADALPADQPLPEKGFGKGGKKGDRYGGKDRDYGKGTYGAERQRQQDPYARERERDRYGIPSSSSAASVPTGEKPAVFVPPSASGNAAAANADTPDFVNMSYDQYQAWYNAQMAKQSAGT